MKIGIIGAGSMGVILARHLARRGHHVSIANSRGPESLTTLATKIGVAPISVADAVQAGEMVILAIPAIRRMPRPQCFASLTISVLTLWTVAIWTTPGGSRPERRLTARTLKPMPSGVRSPKLIEAGSRNTALIRKLVSGLAKTKNWPSKPGQFASMVGPEGFEPPTKRL